MERFFKKYICINMKTGSTKWVSVLCFLLISTTVIAQQITPLKPALSALNAVNIFPSDAENEYRFSDKVKEGLPATFSVLSVNNMSPVFSAEIFNVAKSHYDVQSIFKSQAAVNKGDILLARFAMRSIYAKQESGEAVVYFFVQQAAAPYEKSIIVDISAGPEWKTFDIPVTVITDMKKGEAAICFSFGALAQKVEIANLQLLNFEKKTAIEKLPTTKFTYQGRDTNAAWRVAALKRIDELRTAPIHINVVDAKGKAVANASVKVTILQSDFIWGTAVNEAMLADDNLPNTNKYRSYLKEFFNTGVIENGFKAGRWQGEPSRRAETMKAFNWLEKNGFRQRGHNLVWPAWKFNAKNAKELAEKDTAVFSAYIESDIRSKMDTIKGRVIAWDVINELLHEKDFFPYLPSDISVQWFKLAKQLDPNAQLFINEYGMLNSVVSPRNIQQYIDTVMFLRKQGAPIEAFGIQGHVGRQPRNPAQIISDLDLFKDIALPVQITEFDINMVDEQLQADYTRDFLIACYSHPVVAGFTIWGFWEGAHWKKDAAMFKKDWTEKPNAAVWREWVTKKWKTNFKATTDRAGKVQSQGHLGKYEVTVTRNGVTKSVTYQLTKNALDLTIKL